MKYIIACLMVVAVIANLFLCFWVGSTMLSGDAKWFAIPLVITLVVWFFAVAISFCVIAENTTLYK